MTATRTLPLLLVLATACSPAPTPSTDARGNGMEAGPAGAVASEVRAASIALVEAMNAHVPDSILAFYDLGEDFTYVGCTNFAFAGETFADIVLGYHLANPETRYDMAIQSVRVLGPDAAVVSLRGTSSPDLAIFTTRVMNRDEDGRWRVTWEHESWPGCPAPMAMHPGTRADDSAAVAPPTMP
ncbi:MAG: Cif family virulence factor [Longimicrobiales bacterium]